MHKLLFFAAITLMGVTAHAQQASFETVKVTHSPIQGIGFETGTMRRDPSDVIKVDDLYYVWYSKGTISPGYDATVWYATSKDGHEWTEKGMALDMVAEGKYWLFYTGTSNNFHEKPFNPDSKIGIAVSDSPNGPWERLATNPALSNSPNVADFDSHLVDDACFTKVANRVKVLSILKWVWPSPTNQKALMCVTQIIQSSLATTKSLFGPKALAWRQ